MKEPPALVDDPAGDRKRARSLHRLRLSCRSGEPELSERAIDAVDISKDALDVAARNIADFGLQERVMLHRGDLFEPIGNKRYDLIISNPPYVDAAGMAGLPRECRAEPKLAFDGGADGLDVIRRILDEAGRHLTPEGGLLCEIGRCRPALEAAYPQMPISSGSTPRIRKAKCSGSAPPICEPNQRWHRVLKPPD